MKRKCRKWLVAIQVLLVLILIALPVIPVLAQAQTNWTIEGDKVYIDDDDVYLSATPHTIGSSGWVEFELLSKRYEGEIDAVWGFNLADGIKPSQPQIWAEDVPHTKYRLVDVEKENTLIITGITDFTKLHWTTFEGEPDIGNRNNIFLYEVTADLWDTGIPETLVVAFNSHVLDGDTATITYNYDTTEKEAYIMYYDDWKPLDASFSSFSRNYKGCDTWQFLKLDASIQKDVYYKVRCWVEIPFAGLEQISGKYIFAVKPSGETINEAINSGHLYLLDPWWDAGWNYRKQITIDNTASAENLINFPILVHLDDTNIDWAKVQNAGQDIRFVDDDDTTELDYEIEEWDDTNDAWIWVEVPQIDLGVNTDFIYMYYGNPIAADGQDVTGTWNANFIMVQHLQEAAGALEDSTVNNEDGAENGVITYGATGQISDCIDFNGAAGHIDITPALAEAGTIECYVNVDQVATARGASQYYLEGLYQHTANDQHYTQNATARAQWIPWAATTWHYMVLTWTDRDNPATYEFYSDNLHRNAVGGAANDQVLTKIGSNLTGYVDEVRLQDTDRSADWVEAQYLSMTEAFLTFAAEESSTADSPTNLILTQVADYQVDASWTLGADNVAYMLRRKLGSAPASRVDGNLVYTGADTDFSDTADSIGLELDKYTYYYSVWGQNAAGGWSIGYAEANIGGANLIYLFLGLIAAGLTVGMFATKQMVLGFGSAMFWAVLGAYAYTESATAWGDWQYYLFFVSTFGMVILTIFSAYGLRTRKEEKRVGDQLIDEGKKDQKFIDEGEEEEPEEKVSSKVKGIRARAAKRRHFSR